MTAAEVSVLIQAIATLEPPVQAAITAAYDKIRGNIVVPRPLAEIFAETDSVIAQGIADAEKELSGH